MAAQAQLPSSDRVHPSDALRAPGNEIPIIAPCDHIAGNEKMMRKAIELQREWHGAFDLTCDCEDGAAVGDEQAHALMVARLLNETQSPAGRIGVRIHDVANPHWRNDVALLLGEAAAKIGYITIPKPESAADVARMIDVIETHAQRAGRVALLPIHVLVETHGALAHAAAIAALPGVEALVFGLLDFVSAHHGALGFDAMRSPLQFEHPLLVRAKTDIVAAALSHGVVPVHNISMTLRDEAAVNQDATLARTRFGFLRMWSIHPAQIRPIVEGMRPDNAEVERAGRILIEAQKASWGPIDHGGELHDRASYRHCWTVAQRAHAGGMTLAQDVVNAFF